MRRHRPLATRCVALLAASLLTFTSALACAETTQTGADWTWGTSLGLGAVGTLGYLAGAAGGTALVFQAIESDCSDDLLCGLGDGLIALSAGVVLIGPAAGASAVWGVGEGLGYEGSWWSTWGGAALGTVSGIGLAVLVGAVANSGTASTWTFVVATPLLAGAGATAFYRLSLEGDTARLEMDAPANAVVGYTPERGLHLGAPTPQVGVARGERVGVLPLMGGRW